MHVHALHWRQTPTRVLGPGDIGTAVAPAPRLPQAGDPGVWRIGLRVCFSSAGVGKVAGCLCNRFPSCSLERAHDFFLDHLGPAGNVSNF